MGTDVCVGFTALIVKDLEKLQQQAQGSSVGFTLSDSNTRAPDVSFVRAERL